MSRVEGGPEASRCPRVPQAHPSTRKETRQGLYEVTDSFTVDRCRDAGNTFCSVHGCWSLSSSRWMAITMYFG